MIILRLLLLLTNLHLKLLSTQGTGADKLLSTQRVKERCSLLVILLLESGVTISKSVKNIFFHIVMKFEHFKGLTLNLKVPHIFTIYFT